LPGDDVDEKRNTLSNLSDMIASYL
jgi:hypothetical protein